MPVIGFEWNQQDDVVNHLSLIANKSLILQQDNYKTFDGNSWNTISEPLSAEVFLDKGMDNADFERKVQNLSPQPMEDKTSILLGDGETGKVFSKTLDLGKYMDLRSIKTESRSGS